MGQGALSRPIVTRNKRPGLSVVQWWLGHVLSLNSSIPWVMRVFKSW